MKLYNLNFHMNFKKQFSPGAARTPFATPVVIKVPQERILRNHT